MTEVVAAAAELQAVCDEHGWHYCFIGGLALMRWGEPRETVDADLTLLTGFGDEEPYVKALLDRFEARVPNAGQFAIERRVLLLRSESGVGLDVALGALPYESELVDRASLFSYPPDVPLRTCSAEDLIVLKAFASRGQDWVDIEGVLVRQGDRLDWPYVLKQLTPLAHLKDEPGIIDRLEQLKARLAE